MPYYQLHIDLEFENLQLIGFPASADPVIRCSVKCTGCQNINSNAAIALSDEHESDDGKTMLHYSAVCKVCKATNKVWIARLPALVKEGALSSKIKLPYITDYFCQVGTPIASSGSDEDPKLPTNTLFAVLEARGATITEWELINTEIHATANAKEFFTIEHLDKDGFYDVDLNNESVSVTLVGYRVE